MTAYSSLLRTTSLSLLAVVLSACSGITIRTESGPGPASRSTPASPNVPAKAVPTVSDSTAEGLKLARLMRDQGGYEGAASIYAQLEQRGALTPLELLEYASVAANVQSPQDSLALFGRTRRALNAAATPMTPAATTTLCNGLGRARLALGQHDAALADFDCTLSADPNNVTALNAKGVLLDARGEHQQARQLLTHANELEPADLRTLNNLALSHLAEGDTRQAVRLLGQAAQTKDNPLWPTVQLNLAFAHTLQGDDALARQALGDLMDPPQLQQALTEFSERRQRIQAGAPLAEELLAAGRRLLPLRDKDSHG